MEIGGYERMWLAPRKPLPPNQGVQIGYIKYSWPRLIFVICLWLVLLVHPFLWPGFCLLVWLELQSHKHAAAVVRKRGGDTLTSQKRQIHPSEGGPGWYTNIHTGIQRYWDGERWGPDMPSGKH